MRDMTSSAAASAKPSPQQLTPASSPLPADMEKDNNGEGISDAMQQEEERMRTQREKHDAKREAQLEKERQEDIKSGRDVLDKKFQQLEFLMNKSKVSISKSSRVAFRGLSEHALTIVL
jgi:ATP-dependent DNA helicase